MAEDALNCVTSLLESVPIWTADIEKILKTATDRQNEILFERQPAGSPRQSLRKRASKSSSLRSRPSEHEREGGHEMPEPAESQAPLLRPQLPHLSNSDALRLSQRKRKTDSACSGQQSGPSKYRSRGMVVVYYDGDIQKKFETLVRAIGGCRNSVRKGKMSAKVDSLSRNTSSSSEASSSGGEEMALDSGKLNYKSSRTPNRGLFNNKNDGTEVFDKLDASLETGQSLCEKAAHQILRDGDCAFELNAARQHLMAAKTMAEAGLPALRKCADKAAERRRRSDERQRAKEDADRHRRSASAVRPLSMSSIPSDGKLEVDLEVDESDGDEVDFAPSAMQFGKYQMRSTRLMAG